MPKSCVQRSREDARPWKRIAMTAGVALVLSGCSTLHWLRGDTTPAPSPQAQQTAPPAPPKEVPVPAKPRRPAREVHENREPERVASVDPKSLIGMAPSAVEHLLGTPSNVTKVDPSLVWTYAGQGCSFQVIFYPDLKTASFHALKYTSSGGEQADCIRNILTVKNNGPG